MRWVFLAQRYPAFQNKRVFEQHTEEELETLIQLTRRIDEAEKLNKNGKQ